MQTTAMHRAEKRAEHRAEHGDANRAERTANGREAQAVGRLRSASQRAVEFVLICSTLALLGVLGDRVLAAVAAAGSWWMLPPSLLLGVLLADFGSGAVHWFGDSFLREETPLVGPMLIAPFRQHHRDPEEIARHDLLELHGNSCIPVLAVLSFAVPLAPSIASPAWLFCYATFLFLAVAAVATNQCHVWAHRSEVPRFVATLQRWNVILTPEGHRRHHSGGFVNSYCITTGWWNPLLDWLQFFPRLEQRLRAVERRWS